ncbi:hypothetical protein WJX72_004190 [[Myrmecia] bisecta]|uniref:C2 Aida-type domain-containing protein n=1 Tax=[Myrmecia] bisecta TaxID=41462 RepID=A0AAW1QES8_9CHLO
MAAELGRRWSKSLREGVELDSWGQVEEAAELYRQLVAAIKEEQHLDRLQLPDDKLPQLARLASCLQLRIQAIQNHGPGLSLEQLRLLPSYCAVFLVKEVPFPAISDGGPTPGEMPQLKAVVEAVPSAQPPPQALQKKATLTKVPQLLPGDRAISFLIVKWGFKDASTLVDAFVTVTLVNASGETLENTHDIPISNSKQGPYILFGAPAINLQTPINLLQPGSALFFEFKHFKPQKQKVSTKGYCYMDLDELQGLRTESIVLETYRKPTDLKRRKRPNLLSVKSLYLHLDVTVRTG